MFVDMLRVVGIVSRRGSMMMWLYRWSEMRQCHEHQCGTRVVEVERGDDRGGEMVVYGCNRC